MKFRFGAAALCVLALHAVSAHAGYSQKVLNQVRVPTGSITATEFDGQFDIVYFVLRGKAGNCGALYKNVVTLGDRPLLLHQFGPADPFGCNPLSLTSSSDRLPYTMLGVTTAEGNVDFFQADGKPVARTSVAGTPVGLIIQTSPPGTVSPTGNPQVATVFITASSAGTSSSGAIFASALDDQGKFTVPKIVFDFPGGAGGALPGAPALAGSDGNLYGTTLQGGATSGCNGSGCGVAYRLRAVKTGRRTVWTEDVLYTFQGGTDGGQPNTRVAFDTNGNVYGTTYLGGDLTGSSAAGCVGPVPHVASGCGVVFRLAASGTLPWQESVLATFHDGADGAQPFGPVTLDASGNVYGTTIAGGNLSLTPCKSRALGGQAAGCGVVFALSPSGGTWNQTVLFAFADGTDGAQPSAELAVDPSGNIFGSTLAGGYRGTGCQSGETALATANGCGVLFELVRSKKSATGAH